MHGVLYMNLFDFLITHQNIAAKASVKNWEEAVRKGGELLINSFACTPAYVEGIIETCRANNAAFVIAPGIAMPHTRPEKGAKATGFALVTLETPVNFGDPENDPVDLLFFMVGKDENAHVGDAMVQIGDLCDNAEDLKRLRACRTVQEIISFLRAVKNKY